MRPALISDFDIDTDFCVHLTHAVQPPLPEAVGWVICVALGCFFAALVSVMVWVVGPLLGCIHDRGLAFAACFVVIRSC